MTSRRMKEPQYDACLELEKLLGREQLGLMTNQVYHDDPRRLVFSLSRYKFVSKMLSGKDKVAEVGCGDGFGSRIVLQEVGKLDAYDFDPVFIDDLNARNSEKWPITGRVHDMLSGPLPETYDALYSLDVMEHIPQESEDTYLRNIRASLNSEGVAIIGMPSLESQTYASPQSKEGHVNCKSGKDFKAALETAFKNVFLFSMNDEVVHTGFTPMAHYLLGLCCNPR